MELERPFKVYKKIPDKRHDFYSEIMKINFMLSLVRDIVSNSPDSFEGGARKERDKKRAKKGRLVSAHIISRETEKQIWIIYVSFCFVIN